ncbi:MAG: acetate kinase [Clostridia bacterium]|nr:acetate kinase [Clostridia bacterium]
MKVLVINCGSSSLKFQFIDMDHETVLAKGLVERIGAGGHVVYQSGAGSADYEREIPNHTTAFSEVKKCLTTGGTKIAEPEDISAIGHRIVQGGDLYVESCLVTDQVEADIEKLAPLAPMHNPAHLQGIRAAKAAFGEDVPQVVVFDNAFHSTMPKKAYMYPLPYEYYEKYRVRKYGFHGTSHRYVSTLLGELHPEYKKVVICHLGNGSSLSAVLDGKVVDTSMGLTPLDGFIMGTRCGSIDPAVVPFLMKNENLTPDEMDAIMNKKSGFLGVSGISSDWRDIQSAASEGNERAQLVADLLFYQVAKIIASYMVALQGLDALVFTAGIGENASAVREGICKQLSYLGIQLDTEKNDATHGVQEMISADDSSVPVYVIPTNEELMIARDTRAVVTAAQA